jgi:hypothetical protein
METSMMAGSVGLRAIAHMADAGMHQLSIEAEQLHQASVEVTRGGIAGQVGKNMSASQPKS